MPTLIEEWNLAGDDFRAIAGEPRLAAGGRWELDEGDAIECVVSDRVARAGDRVVALALDVEPGYGFLVCEVVDRGRGDFIGTMPSTKEILASVDGKHQQLWLAELRLIEAMPARSLSRVLEGGLAIRFTARSASGHRVFGARVRRVRP